MRGERRKHMQPTGERNEKMSTIKREQEKNSHSQSDETAANAVSGGESLPQIDKFAEPFRCPTHRELLNQRPKGQQTPEQLWCGTWHDCPRCRYSLLEKSDELMASLEEQRAAYETSRSQGQLPFKASMSRKRKTAHKRSAART
jgi:hypothetical protein